jgi:hypothetical protein
VEAQVEATRAWIRVGLRVQLRRLREEGDDAGGPRISGCREGGALLGCGEPEGRLGRKAGGRGANEAEESRGHSRTFLIGPTKQKKKQKKKGERRKKGFHIFEKGFK